MNTHDRSALRLLASLQRADAAGEAVVLTGNTADVFVAPNGKPCRLPHLLATWASDSGRGCVIHSLGSGPRQLPAPGCSPLPLRLPAADAHPSRAIEEVIRELMTHGQPALLVLDWAELHLPAAEGMVSLELNQLIEILGESAVNPEFARAGHRLVVIARSGEVDQRLRRLPGFVVFHIGLPDREERSALIERLATAEGAKRLHLDRSLTPGRLTTLTGGLTLDDLMRARDETSEAEPLTSAWIQARKSASLRRTTTDGMTVYPPGQGLVGVAGLPQIRRLIDEAKRTGRNPRRILLAGPPGVGKTLVVTAIADELGVPAVALGQFRSRYVGDSERTLDAVLSAVNALKPNVLHIDEFDQAVGQRNTGMSSDGGTSERIFAELLTFLGDSQQTERVTVVGTTNRPDVLDSAMNDRFTIIPVLHPSPSESVAILEIAAKREGRTIDTAAAKALLQERNELTTGRLLVDVLDRAMTFCDLDGIDDVIGGPHLKRAFDDLLMTLDLAEHELLALEAVRLCRFRSFLPWVAAGDRGEEAYLPPYVERLLDADGSLNVTRLNTRLLELRGGTR